MEIALYLSDKYEIQYKPKERNNKGRTEERQLHHGPRASNDQAYLYRHSGELRVGGKRYSSKSEVTKEVIRLKTCMRFLWNEIVTRI